jgi:hypothetical protein
MRLYVMNPQHALVQGIWCYPPQEGDAPDYWCHTVHEGVVICDVPSARRFFHHKVK